MQPRRTEFRPDRLDIDAFARAAEALSGSTPITALQRLASSAHGAQDDGVTGPLGTVEWSARGEVRERLGAAPQVWLHVTASTALPMTCQRCLQPVVEPLEVDRWFRFVASEEEALEQDTDAEEDLLVKQRQFRLLELIEDELLLALPVIARHDVCPEPLPAPDDLEEPEEEETPARHPFAALEALKKSPKRGH